MSTPRRPVLRYHGGKWRLAPWIISHFPRHRTYCEPFAGAASVLMRKERSYSEVINDLDGDVVNLFRVLRDPSAAEALERALRATPFARAEFEDAYSTSGDPVERARRLMIRSYMGHGATGTFGCATGFRCDTRRSGTTPAHDWRGFPSHIKAFTRRLRGVVVEKKPAREMIARHDGPETLFYVDPPYLHSARSSGSYRHEMSRDDHEELAAALRDVEGMVVLSGYPSTVYSAWYEGAGWKCVSREAMADGAHARTECLWLNPAAQQHQAQPSFFNEVTHQSEA